MIRARSSWLLATLLSLVFATNAQALDAGPRSVSIGTGPGRTIALSAGSPRAAVLEAGARIAPGADLRVADLRLLDDGRSAARLEQTIDGVPVLGGELAVGLSPGADLRSVGGRLEADRAVDTTPEIGAGEAAGTAIAAVAKTTGTDPAELHASVPTLAIYDPRILGGPGLAAARAVWRTEVSDNLDPVTVRRLVLVDADVGNVALSFSEIESARNRIVCNAESEPKLVPCTAPLAELIESSGATSAFPDVNAAYLLTGDLYDFFTEHFGRDSIDGAGMPLVSTVDYCEDDECPFENAFWNGEQMVYGAGLVTDDVTGHELTHGIDASESNLFYYYQSGAIDEAIADTFGELFDLATPDAPADRWKIAEDSSLGAIRNMANPPEAPFKQPDRTGSGLWAFDPDTDLETGDNGGVHDNSGVGGKATFLITDGGTFNGRTVAGLGIEKTLQIEYAVTTGLLTSASDYRDYGAALRQGCSDLVGEHGITAADCEQVDRVVLATEMDTPPPAASPASAGLCEPGQTPVPSFSDDLENPGSGNWQAQPSGGPFFYPQEPNTLGLDATYAASGTTNIWGYDAGGITDSKIAMTHSVTVPAGGLMRFAHAHGFEASGGEDYDGGVVEYSTDGGATWKDAGGLIEAGDDYGGPIFIGAENPLSGQPAFVGDSTGYGSTRLDLSSLAGKQVRFRFRIGTDQAQDDYGWFIDDIEVYRCAGEGEPEPEPEPTPPTGPAGPGATPSSTPPPAAIADRSRCAIARAALRRAKAKLKRARRKRPAAAAVRRKRSAVRRACST